LAVFRINDVISLGVNGRHNATSWQVFLDPELTQLIDESIKDTVNVKEWHSPLPKINEQGYYADLDNVYGRVKVFSDDDESPWFTLEPKNQNDQVVIVTEKDVEDKIYNSLEMGLN